ncbi:cyclin-like protein, partial [Rhodotorula sp. JG-1b]
QWLYTPAELAHSTSVRAGLTVQQELHGRARAIKRLELTAIRQYRHQPVISTAATFLHRFYMRETMQQYDPVTAAVAAFFLACKSEEEPRSIKALVQFLLEATRDQRRFRVDRIAAPQTDLPEFQKLRAKVLTYEEAILRSLCYDLTVRNPHWYAVNTAKQVWTGGDGEVETGKRVAQVAWTFLNDSLALPLCLLYRPQLIAGASLVLA